MTELVPMLVDNAIKLVDHVGACVALLLTNWAFILLLHRSNVTRLGRIEANQAHTG